MRKKQFLETNSDAEILDCNKRFEKQYVLAFLSKEYQDITFLGAIFFFLYALCFVCLLKMNPEVVTLDSLFICSLIWLSISVTIMAFVYKRVGRFRRERHVSRIAATRVRQKKAIDYLHSLGLKVSFCEDGLRESDHACRSCSEQVVSITVPKISQPMPIMPAIVNDVSLGAYCPGCGIAASVHNPIKGNVRELLSHLEIDRGASYILRPPTSEEGIQLRLEVLDQKIAQREIDLAQDMAQREQLSEARSMIDLVHSPVGYRVAPECSEMPHEIPEEMPNEVTQKQGRLQ